MDKTRCSTTSEQDVQPSVEILEYVIKQLEAAEQGSLALDYAVARAIRSPAGMPPWAYTTSLDAAMKLKPEGLMVSMTSWLGQAVVSLRTGSITDKDTKEWTGRAKTLPIALCIAALKARKTVPQTVDRAPSDTPNTDESINTNLSISPTEGE